MVVLSLVSAPLASSTWLSISPDPPLAPASSLLIVRGQIEFLELVLRNSPSGAVLPVASEPPVGDHQQGGEQGGYEEQVRDAVVDHHAGGHRGEGPGGHVAIHGAHAVDRAEHEEVRELPRLDNILGRWLVHKNWEGRPLIGTVHLF